MKDQKGFTLIEIIITIIILAVAASMMMALFGRQFTGSAVPAAQVQSQYKLIQQMEIFTSQYRNEITSNPSFNLSTFKSSFIDGKPYVYSSSTKMLPAFTYGTRTSQSYLCVTLRDGDQTLMTIFTN